jgi:hypothetical protein
MSHRNALYTPTPKLNIHKLKGQAAQVARAVLSDPTPQDLQMITDRVKANGEYSVKGDLMESVHYHLR